MGVDLHRIGFGISSGTSRTGFGTIVSFPSGPASFPVAGTILSTNYYYSYPISEGGNYFTYNSQDWESQTVTVDVIADGSGGSSLDWSNERDVANKAFGIGVTFVVDNHAVGSTEVPSGSGNYYTQGIQEGYNSFHDGSGSYYTESGGSFTNHPYGYLYLTLGNTTEVPSGSGNYYDNGYTTDYIADGNGSYTATGGSGTAYANGSNTGLTGLNVAEQTEVPSGGTLYGTGRTIGYTWNGSGGYNYPVYTGSYHSNGNVVWQNVSSTSNQTEVPGGSGTYYDNTLIGDKYLWNGSGGYTYNSSWYYPNGTFIYNDGTNDYFWDGSGSYYT
jgi:hypothetical protein